MMIKISLMIIFVIAGGLFLFAFIPAINKGTEQPSGAAYQACLDRGVTTYKETGSYPVFSDGRIADAVIEQRCKKNVDQIF